LTALSQSLPRRSLLLAQLLLTVALMVLGVHGFRQKLEAFQPLGFQPLASNGQWLVGGVEPSEVDSLQPGDRIVLVDGVETSRIAELRERLAAAPQTQIVLLRGDELVTVTYHRPPLRIDFPWLALALLGVIYLAIGLYTLWRAAEAALFYSWCLASATLYFLSPVFPVDRVGAWIYVADQLARLLLPPLTLHLFLSIPRERRPRWPVRLALYQPAAILSAIQVDLAFFNGGLFVGRPSAGLLQSLDRIEIVHLAAFAATAIVVLAGRLRSTTDWEQHRQLLWLVVGTAGGYLPFLLLYGLPFLAGLRPGQLFTVLAVVPLGAVPLAFGWSVLRYRLWDLGLIVRNGVAHGLTLLVGVGSFALLDMALRRTLPGELSLARDFATFVGGLAIVGLVVPTHRRLQSALERLQHGARWGQRRGLAWLGQELLRERDLDRLCELLLHELTTALDLERANLLLVQGNNLVAVRPELELPAAAAIEAIPGELWSDRFETLSGVGLPGEPARIDLRLYAAGYRYAFPLVVRDSRVGLLIVGYRGDQQPLDSEDIDLVRVLLDQAALAIENARLLDQVQRQLEQVVALQQHSEGILESSPAGIAVVDADDQVASSNLAFASLVGRARSEVVGQRFSSLLDLGTLPEPGEPARGVSCHDALDRLRHLEVTVAWLRSAGVDRRRVVIVQDVTERLAMEQALKDKDRLAALGVLAAGVAHEVNTPLTGISSYAQMLLADTADDDPRRQLLEKVERQTFRASRIVSNLLEFARKPGRERKLIDLGPLLQETAELLRERMASKRARLQWQPPAAPMRVLGSEGELQQVFTNLLLNAVDAMAPEGGGTIRLALATEQRWVHVTIEDEGPGVPPDLGESIFEPFVTSKRGQGGTGLGLSICYSIVDQHGGRIRFENVAPRGCRFTVELPIAETEPSPGA